MSDPTEDVRRALIPQMPEELAARVAAGEQIWDTQSMQADFEALGFLAPFIVVRRRRRRARHAHVRSQPTLVLRVGARVLISL